MREQLISLRSLARTLGVHRDTLARYCDRSGIPITRRPARDGRGWRYVSLDRVADLALTIRIWRAA